MKTNSQKPEIAQIKSAADELTDLLANHDATDDPHEKRAKADLIVEYLRGDSSIFERAHEILDARIQATIADFVSRTRPFFSDEARARRAAENSDLVRSLNHDRNSLAGESIESARQTQSIFQNFLSEGTAEPAARSGAESAITKEEGDKPTG